MVDLSTYNIGDKVRVTYDYNPMFAAVGTMAQMKGTILTIKNIHIDNKYVEVFENYFSWPYYCLDDYRSNPDVSLMDLLNEC